MKIKIITIGLLLFVCVISVKAINYIPHSVQTELFLKSAGNKSKGYPLKLCKLDGSYYDYECRNSAKLPITVFQKVNKVNGHLELTVVLTALDDVYFHYSQKIVTDFLHQNCEFYLPGFWYRHNLRSPKEAPSLKTSDSWTVREDRLSAPLTGIYCDENGASITVNRTDDFLLDALTSSNEGEVLLSNKTSLGYTGFENVAGRASLSFGFPYQETPKTYIRKLTLAPPVKAFQLLKSGESKILTWTIREENNANFSDFIKNTWEYCFDTYKPVSVNISSNIAEMKQVMSNFFTESIVREKELVYMSGVGLRVDDCTKKGVAEVGFVGRVLLNAFNSLEYGLSKNRTDLINNAEDIFNSYENNGFTPNTFFKELINFDSNFEEPAHSIRRQSEGICAVLHFLEFEKGYGKKHLKWEEKINRMLNNFISLQNDDGSFPRKFKDNFTIVDSSSGSTSSATLPLVMGYKYFKDKRFLVAAKKTVRYLEDAIISKADYFSSTLDANCEDKEASISAATATYYLSLVTNGKEHDHYANLCRKSTYFALSWYYVWDVPFDQGQMLGDLNFKSRGWGNVSVENNHIDVFAFEFVSVLKWLSKEFMESRFSQFSEVISTSMRQLLPYKGHMCGVAKIGYYPEVVQHTNWDYGHNGKGFYNDIFAPGWTVASLWEMLSPGRTENFLLNK